LKGKCSRPQIAHTVTLGLDLGESFEDIMNHSVSQVAGPHEAKIRLLRSERKIENEKLGQLKIKLQATANAKKSVARAA
jgi:hypothetical protein